MAASGPHGRGAVRLPHHAPPQASGFRMRRRHSDKHAAPIRLALHRPSPLAPSHESVGAVATMHSIGRPVHAPAPGRQAKMHSFFEPIPKKAAFTLHAAGPRQLLPCRCYAHAQVGRDKTYCEYVWETPPCALLSAH
eukprot:scaffold1449_cov324-Prasinococcus_capsulatus_cf.AAC.12